MKKMYQCPCGEADPTNYYRYRTYECKACLRKKVATGSPKPPECKCGATDPTQFYKNRRSKCKACIALHGTNYYREMLANDEKRAAKNKYNLEYQKRNAFRYRFAGAALRASRKGLDCDISEDFLKELYEKQEGRCFYSGIKFDIDNSDYTWSIDRVDSSKGYTKDNVVLACAIVNSMKNYLSVRDFRYIISKLYHHMK